MPDKLVTLITRTKDRPLFIPRVFETVVQQSYRPIEWIIVNDNGESIDELIETLKIQYADQLDGVEINLINKDESTGMEAASNTGLEHAHGVYVKILDDDDTLDAACIEKQVDYMENEKLPTERGVICYTQQYIEKVEDKKIVHLNSTPLKLTPQNITIAKLAKDNQFTVHSFLYERDVLKEIGNYNEALPVQGDWEFNLRFIMEFDIGVVPEFLVNYHIRKDREGLNGNTIPREHQRYNAVIRNQIIRDEITHPNLSALISNVSTTDDIERKLDKVLNDLKIMMAKDIQTQARNAQIKIIEEQLAAAARSGLDVRDKATFSLLEERINSDSKSADILREVALLFEKNGDIVTAKAVMAQALLQRPEGELIQTKVAQYSELIEKKG